jgi:hypothetical protein
MPLDAELCFCQLKIPHRWTTSHSTLDLGSFDLTESLSAWCIIYHDAGLCGLGRMSWCLVSIRGDNRSAAPPGLSSMFWVRALTLAVDYPLWGPRKRYEIEYKKAAYLHLI